MSNCYSHFNDKETEVERNGLTVFLIFFCAILFENNNFNTFM